MDVHENARLMACGRAEMVRRMLTQGQARKSLAAAFGVDAKTLGKWIGRFWRTVSRVLPTGPLDLTGCGHPHRSRARRLLRQSRRHNNPRHD